MKIKKFPFPSKEAAREELMRDVSISRVPKEDIDLILNVAWERGAETAKKIKKTNEDYLRFDNIISKYNLKIIDKDIDYTVGKTRYFSEYYTKKKVIIMYLKSIEKWAIYNELSNDEAYNLILAHEFFHFLEYTRIGLTSRLYTRPLVQFGKFKVGKTGVKAMSEIGAHAFVYELFSKEEIK